MLTKHEVSRSSPAWAPGHLDAGRCQGEGALSLRQPWHCPASPGTAPYRACSAVVTDQGLTDNHSLVLLLSHYLLPIGVSPQTDTEKQ